MFLLVPAYPGCPGQTAVKWLLLLLYIAFDWRTRAFVVLGLVFSYQTNVLAWGNVSEVTYLVSSWT